MAEQPYDEQVQELYNALESEKARLVKSAHYYEATYRLETIGLATPPEMRSLTASIGWPRMYVDAIEERLDIEGFRLRNKSGKEDSDSKSNPVEKLSDWWKANQLDEESGLAHLDALIYGRSYVTVAAPDEQSGDEPGVPIIRVESPLHVYAETDPRTRKVTRAIRIYGAFQDDDLHATLYLPDVTVPMTNKSGKWVVDGQVIEHKLGIVPVVPIVNRERLSDRDGRSEIIPELRSFTDAASRAMMNAQAASELMAIPQRVFFGVDPENLVDPETGEASIEAYIGRIVALESETAKAFQFTAAELRNFTDLLEELAKHVASYTGLPPQYLSFSSENPASAEAIRSSESRLVKKCERKGRMFGGGWEAVMRLAVQVIEGDVDSELYRLETVWRDPSTPTYAAKADGVMKLYANGMGIIGKERAREDMGYTKEEREIMKKQDEDDPVAKLSALVGGPAGPRAPGAAGNSAQQLQRKPAAKTA